MAAQSIPRGDRPTVASRLVARFLLALMAVGCLVLWIGIPAGCLWIAGQFAETNGEHFLLALPLTLIGMGGFAKLLFWLNRLYLGVTFDPTLLDEDDEEEEPRWARGPLEPLLVGTLLIALAALFVWFFAFAENPPRRVI